MHDDILNFNLSLEDTGNDRGNLMVSREPLVFLVLILVYVLPQLYFVPVAAAVRCVSEL